MSPFDDIPRRTPRDQGPRYGIVADRRRHLLSATCPRGSGPFAGSGGPAGGFCPVRSPVWSCWPFQMFASQPPALNHWIWPPLVLLIAYWSSGLLFVKPRTSTGKRLSDGSTIGWTFALFHAAHLSLLVEVLEAAYAGVYLLIPLALLDPSAGFRRHLTLGRFGQSCSSPTLSASRVLPWVQTRPPRALEDAEPWASSLRRFNLRLLGATSIQVNTFPSGHAAEGLAAALARSGRACGHRFRDADCRPGRLGWCGARALPLSRGCAGGMGCCGRGLCVIVRQDLVFRLSTALPAYARGPDPHSVGVTYLGALSKEPRCPECSFGLSLVLFATVSASAVLATTGAVAPEATQTATAQTPDGTSADRRRGPHAGAEPARRRGHADRSRRSSSAASC